MWWRHAIVHHTPPPNKKHARTRMLLYSSPFSFRGLICLNLFFFLSFFFILLAPLFATLVLDQAAPASPGTLPVLALLTRVSILSFLFWYYCPSLDLTQVFLAAEKLRREKWMKEQTARIQEVTVKGLTPKIQQMLEEHKSEVCMTDYNVDVDGDDDGDADADGDGDGDGNGNGNGDGYGVGDGGVMEPSTWSARYGD